MASQSIFSWLTGVRNKSRHAGNKRVPARRWRPGVESLEDRIAPATVTVTSLDDKTPGDGKVTMREATQVVKTDAPVDGSTAGSGADSIDFAPVLSASGPKTIGPSMIGHNSEFLGGPAFKITSELTIQEPAEANGLTLAGPADDTVDQDATMPMFLVAVHCLAPVD